MPARLRPNGSPSRPEHEAGRCAPARTAASRSPCDGSNTVASSCSTLRAVRGAVHRVVHQKANERPVRLRVVENRSIRRPGSRRTETAGRHRQIVIPRNPEDADPGAAGCCTGSSCARDAAVDVDVADDRVQRQPPQEHRARRSAPRGALRQRARSALDECSTAIASWMSVQSSCLLVGPLLERRPGRRPSSVRRCRAVCTDCRRPIRTVGAASDRPAPRASCRDPGTTARCRDPGRRA